MWAWDWFRGHDRRASAGQTLVVRAPQWHHKWRPNNIPFGEDIVRYEYSRGSYVVPDIKNLLLFIINHARLISERIHCIMPAAAYIPCRCLPVDSRCETTRLIGVPEGEGWSNPAVVRTIKQGALEKYEDLLNGVR